MFHKIVLIHSIYLIFWDKKVIHIFVVLSAYVIEILKSK